MSKEIREFAFPSIVMKIWEALIVFERRTRVSGQTNARVLTLSDSRSRLPTKHDLHEAYILLFSLDVQSTAALDADLETQRQNMFIKAIKLLARKLRVKREISSEQESNVSKLNLNSLVHKLTDSCQAGITHNSLDRCFRPQNCFLLFSKIFTKDTTK